MSKKHAEELEHLIGLEKDFKHWLFNSLPKGVTVKNEVVTEGFLLGLRIVHGIVTEYNRERLPAIAAAITRGELNEEELEAFKVKAIKHLLDAITVITPLFEEHIDTGTIKVILDHQIESDLEELRYTLEALGNS